MATSPLAAIRSAPTTTRSISFLFIKKPHMLSVINFTGILSSFNSHVVKRAPCRNGRVSFAKTRIFFPAFTAARTTPNAVPNPAVARAPALQCVKITLSSFTRVCPCCPIDLFVAISSVKTASASFFNRNFNSLIGSDLLFWVTCFIRLIAQARFTAVGRDCARRSHFFSSSR